MNKIIEAIKLSVEKEFLTTEMLNDIKSVIISNLNNSVMLSITGSFTGDSFTVTVDDVEGNSKTVGGKLYPNIVELVVKFIDEIFKGNIDWNELDLKKDTIELELDLQFVDGRYLEKYDEANDKTIKVKYTIGGATEESVEVIGDALSEESEIPETDVVETSSAEISQDDLENKEVIMEDEGKTEITFVHPDLDQVLEGFKDFLDFNEFEYEEIPEGFILNTEDLQWMSNTLEGLNDIGIIYNTKNIVKEEENTFVDSGVVTEHKLVAMDFEVTNKNEKFVLVFEERHKDVILGMIKEGKETDVDFEYIPVTNADIIEEAGNRLYFDYYTGTNIELINEKRVLL